MTTPSHGPPGGEAVRIVRTRAVVLDENSTEFEIRELELDEPGVGEVLVRYVASGLCHSDLHSLDRSITPRLPMVMGHEGSGVVERVGPGVTRLSPGDHVVCSFVPSCGTCRYCATGRSALCDLGANALTGLMPNGGFRFHDDAGRDYGAWCTLGTHAQRATVPEGSVVKIDPWIPLEVAALVGCGVPTGWGSALSAGGVGVGDITVVYGAGGIGVNAIQGAVHGGAKYVIAIDPVAYKRDTALDFGATHVFATAEDAAEAITELSWGQGADQAIVTPGVAHEEIITAAVAAVGKGGTVVLTAFAGLDVTNIRLRSAEITQNQKTIKGALFGSLNPHYDIVKLLRLYDAGKLKLDELVTKRYTMDQVNEGYADMLEGRIIRGLIIHDTSSTMPG